MAALRVPRSISLPAALAWAGAALLTLGAWLAVPRARAAAGPPLRAILLDVSKSATFGEGWRARARARCDELAAAARARGEEPVAIAYGRGARRFELERADGEPFAGRGEDASELAAALALCEALAAERRLAGIDVVGDGTWTGVEPAPHAERLAARGVAIELRPLPPARGVNVGLAPLASPIEVRRGEPIALEVEVWRHDAGLPDPRDEGVLVTALLRQGAEVQEVERLVPASEPAAAIAPHGRAWRVRFELPAPRGGSAQVEVHAALASDTGGRSPVPEDDASAVEVRAEGQLSVGLLAGASLSPALGQIGADFELAEADPARGFERFDVLLTSDARWDERSAALLDAFVRAGGGWVELAGWTLGAPARPGTSALVPARDGGEPRTIVVLLDASGSMSGAPFGAALDAIAALVECAPAQDALELCFAGADPRAPVGLGAPGERADPDRRRALRERLRWIRPPHGPTRVWAALEGFEAPKSGRTLLVLVSDGRESEREGLASRAERLRAALAGARVELAVVAVGPDPDRELLAALAGGAAPLVEAGDLAGGDRSGRLAGLLERAAAGEALREGQPIPLVATHSEGLAGPLAALEPPELARLARARAAPGADAAWRVAGAEDEVALALRRSGLGASAGFAFVLGEEWIDVRSAARMGPVLAQALRRVAPGPSAARPRLVERGGELVLERAPDDTPAIVPLVLRGRGGERLGELELEARGTPHERSAALPAAIASAAAGDLLLAEADLGPAGSVTLAFAAVRASEFARPPGVFEPPPRRSGPGPEQGSALPRPAAPWVLGAGLASFAAAALAGFFSRRRV